MGSRILAVRSFWCTVRWIGCSRLGRVWTGLGFGRWLFLSYWMWWSLFDICSPRVCRDLGHGYYTDFSANCKQSVDAPSVVWAFSVILFFFLGCSSTTSAPEYAFYHWQTELEVNDSLLTAQAAERLYIKAFDVSWEDGRAQPSAILVARDTLGVGAVPVIFITNEVFTHPTDDLAHDILRLLAQRFPFPYAELQIDCDWTAGDAGAILLLPAKLTGSERQANQCYRTPAPVP